MSQPIISPWVIYFIHVLDDLKDICLVGAIITLAACVICILDIFFWAVDDEDKEKSKAIMRPLVVISFLLWALFIFIPAKNVMIEMIAAKHITYENVHKVTTELKRIEEAFLKYLDK